MQKIRFLAAIALTVLTNSALAYNFHWAADFSSETIDPNLTFFSQATRGLNPSYTASSGGGMLTISGGGPQRGDVDVYTNFAVVGNFSESVTVRSNMQHPEAIASVLHAMYARFDQSGNIELPDHWFVGAETLPIDFATGSYACFWDQDGAGPGCQFGGGASWSQPWQDAPVTLSMRRDGNTISTAYNFVGSDTVYALGSYTDPRFGQPAYLGFFTALWNDGSSVSYSDFNVSYDAVHVPEPAGYLVFAAGLAVMAWMMRRSPVRR